MRSGSAIFRRARRAPAFTRVLAGLLATAMATAALVLGGAGIAQAAEGNIDPLSIETVFDGAQTPNAVDAAGSNGVVASNDVVGYSWNFGTEGLTNGVFTQTLPEGWSWVVSSLSLLNSDSSAYTSRYTLNDGGRTLTATISVGSPGLNQQSLVELGMLRALPSSSVLNGTVYTPQLAVTDAAGTRTVVGQPVTVANEPLADLYKSRGTNNAVGTHDFGAGPVAARYTDFTLLVRRATGTYALGASTAILQQPFVITDSFKPSIPGVTVQPELVGQSHPSATVTMVQNGTAVTITVAGAPATPATEVWVKVRMWVDERDVPTPDVAALVVKNTVTATDWRTTDGHPMIEVDPGNNTASAAFQKSPPTPRGGSVGKEIYAAQNPDAPTFGVDPATGAAHHTKVTNGSVATGAVIAARLRFTVPETRMASNLTTYDFWDPSEQRLRTDAPVWVGIEGGSALDATAYRLEYTTGSDAENVAANSWVASVAEAGGLGAVRGIRVQLKAPFGADDVDQALIVAVPFDVVGDSGTTATDSGAWTSTEFGEQNQSRFVVVQQSLLTISKTASIGSMVAGSSFDYTLRPIATAPIGSATPHAEVSGVVVIDILPPEIVAVDTSKVDAAWATEQKVSPSGVITLVFSHHDPVTFGVAPAPIVFGVTTGLQAAPQGTLVNTATVAAAGNTQSVAARSGSVSIGMTQPKVLTMQKTLNGPDTIEVDGVASWKTTWYNFQGTAQGPSYFVDVLPYNGDGRGSHFSGDYRVSAAEITGLGAAESTLQYTTTPAATVRTAAADDNTRVSWIDAGSDLSGIEGITALRFVVSDFQTGAAGVATLAVSLATSGNLGGDVYANTASGLVGSSGNLGEAAPVAVRVIAGALSGLVWYDQDGDGLIGDQEQGIPNVTVHLQDSGNQAVLDGKVAPMTTTTDAAGRYRFDRLHSGSYRVVVDPPALRVGSVVFNTYDLDGNLNSDSGLVVVAAGDVVQDVDFGYDQRSVLPTLDITELQRTGGVGAVLAGLMAALMLGFGVAALLAAKGRNRKIRHRETWRDH